MTVMTNMGRKSDVGLQASHGSLHTIIGTPVGLASQNNGSTCP